MVHALKIIYQLLKPDGRLIDIHPLDDPRPIEVCIAGDTFLAGWLRETEDYIEYTQASDAISYAINQGWFANERQETFTFTYHAETIIILQDYLAENAKKAIVDDIIIMRAEDLMRTIELDKEVIMKIPVNIARLRPLFQ